MVFVDHFKQCPLFELVGDVSDHDCGSLLCAAEDSVEVNVVVGVLVVKLLLPTPLLVLLLFVLHIFFLFFNLINREETGHMKFLIIWLGLLLSREGLLDLHTGALEHRGNVHVAWEVHLRLLLQLLLGLQKLLLI